MIQSKSQMKKADDKVVQITNIYDDVLYSWNEYRGFVGTLKLREYFKRQCKKAGGEWCLQNNNIEMRRQTLP